MNSIQINPYVFAATISIITFVLGFLLNIAVSSSGKLSKAISMLNNTVTRLDTTIQGMEKLNTVFGEGCEERHRNIDREIERLRNKAQ